MTTHALRFHGRFLGHMTEAEADAIIKQHKDETDPENHRELVAAFDVHPRQPVELLVRGNLVDTFATVEDAEDAREAMRAALEANRSPRELAAGSAAPDPNAPPHVGYALKPSRASVKVGEQTNPVAAKWVKDNPGKALPQDIARTIPVMEERDVMTVEEVAHAVPAADAGDGIEIIDRDAERLASLNASAKNSRTGRAAPGAPARR